MFTHNDLKIYKILYGSTYDNNNCYNVLRAHSNEVSEYNLVTTQFTGIDSMSVYSDKSYHCFIKKVYNI